MNFQFIRKLNRGIVQMLRIYSILAGLVLVSGLGAGLYLVLRSTPSDQFADCRSTAIAGGNATIGGPFELTDHTDRKSNV